jgi:hypothetical protein
MTAIVAVGTTQADSADITVPAGSSTVLSLQPAAGVPLSGSERAEIRYKVGTEYITIGSLRGDQLDQRVKLLTAGLAGITYRVRKFAGPAFGIDAL